MTAVIGAKGAWPSRYPPLRLSLGLLVCLSLRLVGISYHISPNQHDRRLHNTVLRFPLPVADNIPLNTNTRSLRLFGCQGTACNVGDGVGKAYGSANDTVGNVWHQVQQAHSHRLFSELILIHFFTFATNPPKAVSSLMLAL